MHILSLNEHVDGLPRMRLAYYYLYYYYCSYYYSLIMYHPTSSSLYYWPCRLVQCSVVHLRSLSDSNLKRNVIEKGGMGLSSLILS